VCHQKLLAKILYQRLPAVQYNQIILITQTKQKQDQLAAQKLYKLQNNKELKTHQEYKYSQKAVISIISD
jgi:hypothetical protein